MNTQALTPSPPANPEAAALLLVLREGMHHLGYEGVVRG